MVGIQPGDILLSVDDVRITNMDSLESVIYEHEVGDTVRVIIYRSGRQYTADLKLSESKG
jgi:serine protease Do